MMAINLLVVFLPVLFAMGGVWIECICMDNLPKYAFKEKRKALCFGLMFLILVIGYLAVATYLAIDMIQTQYTSTVNGN